MRLSCDQIFRPLELDPYLPSSAGAELGLDFPDFSSGEEYSGLTSSLGSEILMGLLGRLDVRQLFSRKCGSCLDLENNASFPLFVKTFLWTRDCSPVVLFHFLGSILHLNEGCSNRFKIIKRNWALGTRYLEKLTTKCLVMADQLSPVVVNLPVIISCIGKGLH